MKSFVFRHAAIIFVPLFALLLIESIHRSSIVEVGSWIIREPKEVVVSYLLYFSFFNIFYLIHQKLYLWVSYGMILILAAFAFISHVKTMYRGVPLHPSDFVMIREALSVKDYLYAALDWKLIVFILILLFAMTLFTYKNNINKPISINMSMTLFALSGITIFSLFTGKPFPLENWGNISTMPYAQAKHYDMNGFSLGFALLSKYEDTTNTAIPYSKKNVLEITQTVEKQTKSSDFRPNVLYIMSESFWDPTIIDSLKLEKDPIPFFRKLKEETTHGELVVSVFGGNTGNTEFEALTGMSIWFLGGSHMIPFNEGIEQPIDSLASMLTRQGYVATAMHPFNMGYYNRYETYRELGFQNYIPPEYMYNRELRGKYVSDHVLMKQVVDQVETTDKPVFVHAVTMENHGPYDGEKFKEHTIAVEGPLSAENKKLTEDFVQGLIGADASLKYLIGELERISEPTVVVFFGDHLPYLGQFEAYKQLGFIENENLEKYEDFMNIHTTPFLIWNNFDKEKEKEELRMSSNFLAPYVLDLIQKDGNIITDYLQGLMKQGKMVTPSPQFNEKEGITPTILEPYELLQYDTLTGLQFAYDKGLVIEQEDFHFGAGKMKLNEVKVRDSKLELKGEHFVPASKAWVNGAEVETAYHDPETLTASIPNDASGEITVEVVVMDEWVKTVLEKTKSIKVER